MHIVLLLNIITPFLSLWGMILVGHKNKRGFLVFLAVECSLCYIGIATGQYGIIAMAVLYFFTDMYAHHLWTKGERKLNEDKNRRTISRGDNHE